MVNYVYAGVKQVIFGGRNKGIGISPSLRTNGSGSGNELKQAAHVQRGRYNSACVIALHTLPHLVLKSPS
jgi:hypothetical protein